MIMRVVGKMLVEKAVGEKHFRKHHFLWIRARNNMRGNIIDECSLFIVIYFYVTIRR